MIGAVLRLVFVNLLWNMWLLVANFPRLFRVGRRPRWVEIVVKDPLPARPTRAGRLFRRGVGPSLEGLHKLLDELRADPALEGVVVRLEPVSGGWARLQSLRTAFARFREGGKRLVFHLSGGGLREIYVACAGDTILMDESSHLGLTGLSAEVFFWAGAFEKAGVEAQLEQRKAYKSFAETFTRKEMTPAHREALDAILDHVEGEVKAALAAGRKVTLERAGELLTGGPYPADIAAKVGLVDHVCYRDEIAATLGKPPPRLATVDEWRGSRFRPLVWRPLFRRPRRIRVIALHGAIVGGEGAEAPRRLLGAEAANRALEAARRDRRVAGVVLHVDSRGGSAPASDLIWREVVRLGREKPVVAYFDDVAASGGYYLACAAHRIVAQPGTLTGSIGVVAGKFTVAGLWDRLGVHVETVTRGEAAGMSSPSRGYSAEERRRLNAEIDAFYAQFVKKVAEGRRLDLEAAERVAQGRVWTGADAHARGLVDQLGDVRDAVTCVEEKARRYPGEKLVVEDATVSPRRRTLLARLMAAEAPALPESIGDLLDEALLSNERVLYLATSLRIF